MPQSVILIPVPSADPIIGKWREQYDSVVLRGIPSHITLLFPFKNPSEITEEVLSKLSNIFIGMKPFSFVLETIQTFPNVIFLEPKSKEPFIQITEEIVKVFPENPPYEGKYPSINPHATIAQLSDDQDMSAIKKNISEDIDKFLPIQSIATEAWVMVEGEDDNWHRKAVFVFGSGNMTSVLK